MVRHVLCCVAVIGTFAAMSATAGEPAKSSEPRVQATVVAPKQEGEPTRVETSAGTFQTANPKAAELIRKAIAGDEHLSKTVYAGGLDTP